jgi:hypothetical protein
MEDGRCYLLLPEGLMTRARVVRSGALAPELQERMEVSSVMQRNVVV